MTKLAIAAVALALAAIPAATLAQSESGAPAMMAPHGMPPMANRPMMQGQPPMAQPGGDRWERVPGGRGAYQRPTYGYTLPRYWVSAPFYVSNWSAFGLPRPASGYGWSRYYDDVVLTDRYGRVYDWRDNVDWSRDARWSSEDYSDSYGYRDESRRSRGNGVAGAVIGGVVGGIAGNAIAGDGNRLVGSLVGGTVGAIAGSAIEKSANARSSSGYNSGDRYRDGSGWHSGRGPARTADGRGYSYDGQWTGSWDGGPTQTYRGRFDGRVQPHWSGGYADAYPQSSGYGYSSGYGGGWIEGPPVTTVIVTQGAPTMTKTVSYVTEYVSVAGKRRAYRAPSKDRCLCGK